MIRLTTILDISKRNKGFATLRFFRRSSERFYRRGFIVHGESHIFEFRYLDHFYILFNFNAILNTTFQTDKTLFSFEVIKQLFIESRFVIVMFEIKTG